LSRAAIKGATVRSRSQQYSTINAPTGSSILPLAFKLRSHRHRNGL